MDAILKSQYLESIMIARNKLIDNLTRIEQSYNAALNKASQYLSFIDEDLIPGLKGDTSLYTPQEDIDTIIESILTFIEVINEYPDHINPASVIFLPPIQNIIYHPYCNDPATDNTSTTNDILYTNTIQLLGNETFSPFHNNDS